MAHRFVGLLGGGVDRQLGVGLLGFGKGHVLVRAVDRGGRGHQEVLDLQPPRGLHDVEGADDVRVDIGARVFQAIAYAGLCSEVDNSVGTKIVRNAIQQNGILQHPLGCREIGILQQHRVALLFKGNVVVVCHPVEPVHDETFRDQ